MSGIEFLVYDKRREDGGDQPSPTCAFVVQQDQGCLLNSGRCVECD